ncbi:MAG: pyridoxal phosphate-dependent aminotransferase [Clostridium sp.]|nr:pyridoxal phosphate-dependent aminotransferase [Clostridium sp.]
MFPVDNQTLRNLMAEGGISDIGSATIRQIVSLSGRLELLAGEPCVHLELGNPGIESSRIGVLAECEALNRGIANKYPDISGLPALKKAGSKFIRAFLDIDIPAADIVPTVGSMQGCFTSMLLLRQRDPRKDAMLFLNPGFPAQRHQAKVLGLREVSLDIYSYRGKALEAKLEEILSKGDITAILYSTPNNPAWTNLTEEELEIIGRMATRYDAIVLEDHAYFGMDFRRNFGVPFEAPFVPTVARYTDNYILLLSASKIFSYAGQRIALVAVSPALAERRFPALEAFYDMPTYLGAYIFGVLYCASSGTAHSAQYAMAAMLDAAADGHLDFVGECREYERRSHLARELFLASGFHLVYDCDGEAPISDGFFFTAGFPAMTGDELQFELLRYGVATISLKSTGSLQEGVRVCVSMLNAPAQFNALGDRLKAFATEFSPVPAYEC